jgi:hypothetical protein
MWHVWWKGEIHRGFWWGNLKKIVLLDDLVIGGRKVLKWIIKKWGVAWIGLICLRIAKPHLKPPPLAVPSYVADVC